MRKTFALLCLSILTLVSVLHMPAMAEEMTAVDLAVQQSIELAPVAPEIQISEVPSSEVEQVPEPEFMNRLSCDFPHAECWDVCPINGGVTPMPGHPDCCICC